MNKELNDVEITHDIMLLPLPQAVETTQFSIPLGLNVWTFERSNEFNMNST